MKQFLSDDSIIILSSQISPDNSHKILNYQFDTGALGYSREFWAILPIVFDTTEPLNDYIIPDGYRALCWTSSNEAVLMKFQPYYYKDKDVQLHSGDILLGVKIKIVDSAQYAVLHPLERNKHTPRTHS